ncbi:hypothetical protein DFJ77DRAFT_438138 [Powellomyces hirtus]|nr:hypothetical protein DFJ77DRAFT_438138 [Powellomyces hirtus]
MGLISATNQGSHGNYNYNTSSNGNHVRVQNGGGRSNAPGYSGSGGVYGGGNQFSVQMPNNNGSGSSSSLNPASTTTTNPSEICRIQNAPYLIENLRQRQETHITPHIQRDRDETIVQQIVQPVKDQVTAPAVHHHAQAQQINREIADALDTTDARRYREQRQVATTGGKSVERIDQGVFQNDPVVKERVNVHVIEEIQPVIWRTIDETHVYHTAQPIYEHHTGAPKVQEIRYNPPISMEEFEKRGGSMTGTGLYCERSGTSRVGY